MERRILCGVLAMLFLLTGVAVYAETMPDIQAHKNCKYCGMDREKFAHSRMLTEYTDGSSFGSCSIHCTAIDLAQTLEKQPKAIMAADYDKKNLIDAEKAYWVIGGKKPGVMTKTAKWAFADKKDAEAFIKENGGKLANFEDAMKTTYEDMYDDTKMIREKRAKMKTMQKEEHKPLASAQDVAPAKITPADKCPVCGMFVAKYPDFVDQIVFKDGTHAFFDGVKDMMKYYFDMQKYNPGKTQADIAAILVTDYFTLKLSDGLKAWYVVGSDVYGPMGKELMPFKDEAAAKEFKVDHKGTAILSFQNITPALIKTLDQ